MDAHDLHGTYPALVTPLTPEREVDLADVHTLVTGALADGATGVLVAGTTGEGALLEPHQRVALTRAAVDAAGDDGTVIAGASGPTPAAVTADVLALAEAGAHAVLVLAPHTYRLAPDELADLHLAVAEAVDVPTLAYHIPQLTGSALTPEALVRLADHPGIVGIKDSSPDADRRAAFVAAVADRDLAVLTGHVPTLVRAFDEGAHGAIVGIGSLRQATVTALHAAHAAGDRDAAREHQDRLERTVAGLATAEASVPAALKAALQLQGTITERWCRPPLRSVEGSRLDRVRTALLR